MKEWHEKPARKKFVSEQVGRLKKLFFLDGWTIHINYFKDNQGEAAAKMTTEWNYRRATLSIYPRFWDESEDEQKDILVHEFCHVLVAQPFLIIDNLREGYAFSENQIEDIHEHVTSWIAQIILNKSRQNIKL